MVSELELRTCGRAGCRWPAAASLSFRYDSRQVWLQDLTPEPHPALYDLCPHHADTLTVPRGWERLDQRQPHEAVHEPSSYDLEVLARGSAEVGPRPRRASGRAVAVDVDRAPDAGQPSSEHGEPVTVAGGNRYAALTAALPRLAQEHGTAPASSRGSAGAAEPSSDPPTATEPSIAGDARPGGGDAKPRAGDARPGGADAERLGATARGVASAAPTAPGERSRARTPVPSRDLAPMAVEPLPAAGPARSAGSAPAAEPKHAPPSDEDVDDPLPGQLAIPVDELGATGAPGEAVVVSIEAAGTRRRGAPRA